MHGVRNKYTYFFGKQPDRHVLGVLLCAGRGDFDVLCCAVLAVLLSILDDNMRTRHNADGYNADGCAPPPQ